MVLCALGTYFLYGRTFLTVADIYRLLSGKGDIRSSVTEEISKAIILSIQKMSVIQIQLDLKSKKGEIRESANDYLLNARDTLTTRSGHKVRAIEVLDAPYILKMPPEEFCFKNSFQDVNENTFNSGIKVSKENFDLQYYLWWQLYSARKNSQPFVDFSLDDLYSFYSWYRTDDVIESDSVIKKRTLTLRNDVISRIFSHWKSCHYLLDFNYTKSGRVLSGIHIIL